MKFFGLCALITLLSGANALLQPHLRQHKHRGSLQMRSVDSVPTSPKVRGGSLMTVH
jgi:hypothetical protein